MPEEEAWETLETVLKNVRQGDLKHLKLASDRLKNIKANDIKLHQDQYQISRNGETALHTAIIHLTYNKGKGNEEKAPISEHSADIIKTLLNTLPELLGCGRNSAYEGQTPLHIAIAKGDVDAVTAMIRKAITIKQANMNESFLTRIMHKPATGKIFVNTVMMGELPLFVAALNFDGNFDMINLLLQNGAEIDKQNTKGDTVFHSLIKYAAIHPNKINNILKSFDYLANYISRITYPEPLGVPDNEVLHYVNQSIYIWFVTNNENLTPLQLAANLRVAELFQYILEMKDCYHFINAHDGLFDVNLYDITDIDTRSNYLAVNGSASNCGDIGSPTIASVLEMLCYDTENTESISRMICLEPVNMTIKAKWSSYAKGFYFWMIMHFLIMASMTAYIIIRGELQDAKESNKYINRNKEEFVYAFRGFAFSVGIIYFIIDVILVSSKFRIGRYLPNLQMHPLKQYYLVLKHNVWWMIFLLLFSTLLIVDSALGWLNQDSHIILIVVVISGWWFSVFFLTPIRRFSFFTVMIQRILFGDFFRFFVFIAISYTAFSASMYALLAGKGVDSTNFYDTFLAMFKLMVGLAEIEILDQARYPALAMTLFLVFVILAYVITINSLIAMMSQTCSAVCEDMYPQWRIQQVSVILVLEDILRPIARICTCLRNQFYTVGEIHRMSYLKFNNITKPNAEATMHATPETVGKNRYFLRIHSLVPTYAFDETEENHPRRKIDSTLQKISPKEFESIYKSCLTKCSVNAANQQAAVTHESGDYSRSSDLEVPSEPNTSPSQQLQEVSNAQPSTFQRTIATSPVELGNKRRNANLTNYRHALYLDDNRSTHVNESSLTDAIDSEGLVSNKRIHGLPIARRIFVQHRSPLNGINYRRYNELVIDPNISESVRNAFMPQNRSTKL